MQNAGKQGIISFVFRVSGEKMPLLTVFFLLVGGIPVMGQFFQGTCVYKVTVKSKVDDLGDAAIHKVLATGDVLTVTMKDGNYKLATEYADTYIIRDDRKEYIKFRKID